MDISLHELFNTKEPTWGWQAECVDHASSLLTFCIQVLVSLSGSHSQQMTHGDAAEC